MIAGSLLLFLGGFNMALGHPIFGVCLILIGLYNLPERLF